MDNYLLIKTVHIACAAISVTLFVRRGVWLLRDEARLRHTWVRVLPHAVDTILLGSAVALMVMTGQYPGIEPWLTIKLLAVVFYIMLGVVAFRLATTRLSRLISWLGALVMFMYVVFVALAKRPVPF